LICSTTTMQGLLGYVHEHGIGKQTASNPTSMIVPLQAINASIAATPGNQDSLPEDVDSESFTTKLQWLGNKPSQILQS
ncbi:hypothetical protein ACFL17_03325, partial [Pseudomonadota bacterium]